MANSSPQLDNATFWSKLKIRRSALAQVQDPVIMETHGGEGKIYQQLYHDAQGVVFEKDATKAAILAQQRPHWAVYEGDCVSAIAVGAGAHLAVNFLDVDPYGDPWPVIEAFFTSDRPRVGALQVVVNDGLTQKLQMKQAWQSKQLRPMVERFGNELYREYEQVAQIMMQEKAALAGYSLDRWYITRAKTGAKLHNYHYWAVLRG